jgi:hypothetical protein
MHINEFNFVCFGCELMLCISYLPNQNIEVVLCATIGGDWGEATSDGDLIVCLDKSCAS